MMKDIACLISLYCTARAEVKKPMPAEERIIINIKIGIKTIFAFRLTPNQNIVKKVTNNAMKKSSKPATIGAIGIINLGKYTLVMMLH